MSSSTSFQPYPPIELTPLSQERVDTLKDCYYEALRNPTLYQQLRQAEHSEAPIVLVGFHSLCWTDVPSLLYLLDFTTIYKQTSPALLALEPTLVYRLHHKWQFEFLNEFSEKLINDLEQELQEAEQLNLSEATFWGRTVPWHTFSNLVQALQHWKDNLAQWLLLSSTEKRPSTRTRMVTSSGTQHTSSTQQQHLLSRSTASAAGVPSVKAFIPQGLTTTAVASSKPFCTGSSSLLQAMWNTSSTQSSSGMFPLKSSSSLLDFLCQDPPPHLLGSTPSQMMTSPFDNSASLKHTAILSSESTELYLQQSHGTHTKPTMPTTSHPPSHHFPGLEHPPCPMRQQHQRPLRSVSPPSTPPTPLIPSPVCRMAQQPQSPMAKLPDPPEYEGAPTKFWAFKDQLSLIFSSFPQYFWDAAGAVDNHQKVMYTLRGLTGGTATGFCHSFLKWKYDQAMGQYNVGMWNDFINVLWTQFKSQTEEAQAQEKIHWKKIDLWSTDVLQYNQEFDYLLTEAGIENDRHQVQLYEDSLPYNLHQIIALQPQQPVTYNEWKTIIMQIIQNLQTYNLCQGKGPHFALTSFFDSNRLSSKNLFQGIPMEIDHLAAQVKEYESDKEESGGDITEVESEEEEEEEEENKQGISVNTILTAKQRQWMKEGKCIVCGQRNHWAHQCPKCCWTSPNKNYCSHPSSSNKKPMTTFWPIPMDISTKEIKKNCAELLNRVVSVLLKEQDFWRRKMWKQCQIFLLST